MPLRQTATDERHDAAARELQSQHVDDGEDDDFELLAVAREVRQQVPATRCFSSVINAAPNTAPQTWPDRRGSP